MGNKPIKIGLQLEKAKYQAGETISGKVFLSANRVDKDVSGVHLQLLGVEHVEIREDTNEGYSRTHGSTHTIIKSEYPLVSNIGIQSTGHFEYKFNWKIPPELPGTLHCCHDDQSSDGRNTSFCEISYTLTAYVANNRNPFTMPENADRKSTVALQIIQLAAPLTPPPATTLHHRQPQPTVVMDTDVFPITACCIWDRGSIHLGFHADTPRASPGETVQVLCWGQNKSRLEIEYISAKVCETVTWKTHDNIHTDSTKRVLVEERLSVRAYAQWRPPATRKAHQAVNHDSLLNNNSGDSSSSALTFNLALPSYARDTVAGRLIQVRHVLVVTAVTAGGCCTTSPEMACAIRIVPAANTGEFILDVVPASSDIPDRRVTEYDPNQHLLVEVQALPDDWHPIEVGVITLPQASVIFLDDEERVQSWTLPNTVPALTRRMPPSAGLTSTTSTTTVASSAPDESLLFDAGRPVTPKLAHLLSLASEDPTNISVVLEDPGWQAVVQSLSPRDYCSLVKAASGGDSLQHHQQTTSTAPCVVVARVLAMQMGKNHFQSRHILACLWALHDEADRIQVLCAIAPLASDLLTTENNDNNNRTMIEQELNAVELASFRATLAALQ
jgi:Arrestin (or S-antigen), N-terminal domain/Arrestin (or S-antigen), C-terminal domain